MKKLNWVIILLSILGLSACDSTIVIANFEGDSFGEWIVEGTAFGLKPAKGAVEGQLEVSGFEGESLANSFHGGDDAVGKLISPEFVIERNYINFLIGGGVGSNLYIELLVDGERVRLSNSIVNDERLLWLTWDVKQYKGKQAYINIVDNQQGGWGHILVDQIEMSNKAKSTIMPNYDLTFNISQKYLLIPIEDKGPESVIYVSVDGKKQDFPFYIRVAQTKIDYWMPMVVEQYKGKEVTLNFHHVKKGDIGFKQIKASNEFNFEYNETYRPVYHFSSNQGWINDPNGMVYHNGEYHLYYQHNPYGSMWGNMHWGHAVSKDMIHWEHLPVAIAPDSLGAIFSGSAIVDTENTAGFGKDALIAIYTSAGERQTQSIAYSLDNGRTFTAYEGNPVLKNDEIVDFRDPKVFWHEKGYWVMSLATSQTITFYRSNNLKEWTKLSEFGEGIGAHGGVWECPDLFKLTTPEGKSKWVLLVSINPGGPNGGSATQYFIGDFDGVKFTPDKLPYPLWIDSGRDNYAGVTWNNAPDGRQLFIGWMSNWDYSNDAPTTHFRNGMTLPRDLSLKHNGEHLILASTPVKEVDELRGEAVVYPTQRVERNELSIEKLLADNKGTFIVEMTIVPNGSSIFGFGLTNTKGDYVNFTFDSNLGELQLDRRESGLIQFNPNFASQDIAKLIKREEYKVQLFFDKASVELFVNDGEMVMTSTIFQREVFNRMVFFGAQNNWTAKDVRITPITL